MSLVGVIRGHGTRLWRNTTCPKALPLTYLQDNFAYHENSNCVFSAGDCYSNQNEDGVMIHLRNRTEYSFGYAVGRTAEVLAAQEPNAPAAITDRHGTWGHIRWAKECAKTGHRPIFGVELAVVEDVDRGKEKQPTNYVTLLA